MVMLLWRNPQWIISRQSCDQGPAQGGLRRCWQCFISWSGWWIQGCLFIVSLTVDMWFTYFHTNISQLPIQKLKLKKKKESKLKADGFCFQKRKLKKKKKEQVAEQSLSADLTSLGHSSSSLGPHSEPDGVLRAPRHSPALSHQWNAFPSHDPSPTETQLHKTEVSGWKTSTEVTLKIPS